jgi:hypothetical protein
MTTPGSRYNTVIRARPQAFQNLTPAQIRQYAFGPAHDGNFAEGTGNLADFISEGGDINDPDVAPFFDLVEERAMVSSNSEDDVFNQAINTPLPPEQDSDYPDAIAKPVRPPNPEGTPPPPPQTQVGSPQRSRLWTDMWKKMRKPPGGQGKNGAYRREMDAALEGETIPKAGTPQYTDFLERMRQKFYGTAKGSIYKPAGSTSSSSPPPPAPPAPAPPALIDPSQPTTIPRYVPVRPEPVRPEPVRPEPERPEPERVTPPAEPIGQDIPNHRPPAGMRDNPIPNDFPFRTTRIPLPIGIPFPNVPSRPDRPAPGQPPNRPEQPPKNPDDPKNPPKKPDDKKPDDPNEPVDPEDPQGVTDEATPDDHKTIAGSGYGYMRPEFSIDTGAENLLLSNKEQLHQLNQWDLYDEVTSEIYTLDNPLYVRQMENDTFRYSGIAQDPYFYLREEYEKHNAPDPFKAYVTQGSMFNANNQLTALGQVSRDAFDIAGSRMRGSAFRTDPDMEYDMLERIYENPDLHEQIAYKINYEDNSTELNRLAEAMRKTNAVTLMNRWSTDTSVMTFNDTEINFKTMKELHA